jgi:hypothetical protein
MQPIASTIRLQLDSDTTSAMVIRRHASASFEVRLENPSLTYFHTKQAIGSRRMSCVDLSLSILWRNRHTESHLVLRPKPRNRRGDFEAQITKL